MADKREKVSKPKKETPKDTRSRVDSEVDHWLEEIDEVLRTKVS